MRVIGVVEFGGPDALQVVEVPEPEIGEGQVRIQVHAAAVSPTDTYIRNGARAEAQRAAGPPPYVPGMDAAGELAEIGPGVTTDLIVGDRVMAIVLPSGTRGGYAEQIVVPSESVARVPAGRTYAEASTLPMNGLTARLALDILALSRGQVIAVTGAAGAFGGYVVQMAKAEGLRVVADSSETDEELIKALGADVVVRRGDDVADRILEAVPGGVDGMADGALLHDLVLPAMKDGATVATVRGYQADAERGVKFTPVWVRDYARSHDRLDRLREQVEKGQITLRVARTLPAADAPEAHRLLEAGGVRGRLVLEW